jgi:two-component system chemotaxis sensor kinase CheA
MEDYNMSPFTKKEMKEMKEMFINESQENIIQLEAQIRNLEQDFNDNLALIEMYRIIHSFKGSSGTVGITQLEKFFHRYESFISSIQNEKIKINKEIIDIFYESLDLIELIISEIRNNESLSISKMDDFEKQFDNQESTLNKNPEEAKTNFRIRELLSEHGLEDFKTDNLEFDKKGWNIFEISIELEENIKLKLARLLVVLKKIERIGIIAQIEPQFDQIIEGKFDNVVKILFQSEFKQDEIKKRILSAGEIKSTEIKKITQKEAQDSINQQKMQDSLDKINQNFSNITQIHTIKVGLDDLDKLVEHFGELLIRSKQLESLIGSYERTDINEILFQMQNYMFNLQDTVLQMQLVPISRVFRVFPRMVRNLAGKQNKEINFKVQHNDVKIDRKLLNEIGDIVNHLVRNSIFHGIETKDYRENRNKDTYGTITINTRITNNILNLNISDDGLGIDPKIIGDKAIEKGLFTAEQINSMSVEEIINIIFIPNFSTTKIVNKISGRGLGLNIVQKSIESLGGSISLETHVNIGTTFRILLPISRSLIRALLVQVEKEIYSIPLDDIEHLFTITVDDIIHLNNQYYASINEGEDRIPLLDLGKHFQISSSSKFENKILKIVHIKKGNKNFGIIVDDFIKESEIVIKKIEDYEGKVKGISGAAILDDGTVSLIIDPFTFSI